MGCIGTGAGARVSLVHWVRWDGMEWAWHFIILTSYCMYMLHCFPTLSFYVPRALFIFFHIPNNDISNLTHAHIWLDDAKKKNQSNTNDHVVGIGWQSVTPLCGCVRSAR